MGTEFAEVAKPLLPPGQGVGNRRRRAAGARGLQRQLTQALARDPRKQSRGRPATPQPPVPTPPLAMPTLGGGHQGPAALPELVGCQLSLS